MPSKLKVGSVPNKHSLLVPSKKGTPHQIFNHKVTKYTNPQKEPTHNHRIYHKNQKKLVPPPTPLPSPAIHSETPFNSSKTATNNATPNPVARWSFEHGPANKQHKSNHRF